MIILDANVPLYAYDSSSPHHGAARRWLQRALDGTEPIGLPWITLIAFIRISTNPRAFARPLTIDEAFKAVQGWLGLPSTTVIDPTEGHLERFGSTAQDGQATGPMVTDAHLAALTIERGATLCSTDRDFFRFPQLKLVNPLSAQG